ncbi:alpha/beta hydrolase [Spiractinospora alimapuensis]|uniref:alpha/beta fold hydrolase n=1 Tax=Spiractinospora alimapuensis TaxID=2820884 RepID=UPI001F39CBA6|nr:alpha/beta hydrolase [Spiractinospora alimapuensis]QVQ50868.1 alpha/beta hydrolase [Spiractinospora alimapuensis]
MRREIERSGARIRYWVDGPEDGPLVVLTHGASMDHRMFDAQLPVLHETGYRTLTWDLRGHGASKPIGDGSLTVRTMSDDLLAVLDAVGHCAPVCLVGQSLGGYVAQEMEFAHRDRVSVLVIIGSTCVTLPVRRWEEWALRSSPWWFRVWPYENLRRVISRATAVTPAVRAYAYEATGALTKTEFVAVWRAVATSLHPDPQYTVTIPLLLTHGDGDGTGNIAASTPQWAARDTHARYEVIPNAGHNANQDNPEAFNELLVDFLTEHYPVGQTHE